MEDRDWISGVAVLRLILNYLERHLHSTANNDLTTVMSYKNRLRYRLMAFIPLNKPKMEEGAWFIGLYDEIFVNTESVFFDRNRLYGALGYQINQSTGVQVGYLRQRVESFGNTRLKGMRRSWCLPSSMMWKVECSLWSSWQ